MNLPRSSVCECVCVSSAEGKEGRRMRLPPPLFFLHLFYCPHLRNRDPALNSPPMADRRRHMETERETEIERERGVSNL